MFDTQLLIRLFPVDGQSDCSDSQRNFVRSVAALCPVASIQIPVADGFGNVVRQHFSLPLEVGDGAGHFQDAAVGAGTQAELFHGDAQQFQSRVVGLGMTVYEAFVHLCVAMHARLVIETLRLQDTSLHHPLPDTRQLGSPGAALEISLKGSAATSHCMSMRVAVLYPKDFVQRLLVIGIIFKW